MKQLKNTLIASLVISMMFVLLGCPYSSKVPVDQPNEKINNNLLGKWINAKDVAKDKPEYYQIADAGNNMYKISKFRYNSSDSSYREDKYMCHTSKIGDNLFLNMQPNDSKVYYLYRIDLKNNRFTLYEVTDNIDEEFNNSEELKAFIKKYMHLSFFYNKDEKAYVKE